MPQCNIFGVGRPVKAPQKTPAYYFDTQSKTYWTWNSGASRWDKTDESPTGAINANTIDGYSASTTPTANTIPVIDANNQLNLNKLSVTGAFTNSVSTVSGNVTLNDTHSVVLCNASGGALTVNLPQLSTCLGREYVIMKTDSSANAVTIDAYGTELINAAQTLALSAQWKSATIVATATAWVVIATT